MRFKNRFQRFMNHRAPANGRYKPTCYEHAANCYTHAFLIVPAIVGSALLHRLSDDCWEKITAWIYGMGLCALFIVSTVFHIVSWKKSHLRYRGWHASSPDQSSRLRVASPTGMFQSG